MLWRESFDKLKSFKERKTKKCLMIRGARQIGKTFTVEAFGKDEYPSFVEVNFIKTPALKAVFEGNLDVDTLILNFSVYLPQAEFIPHRTLLFLDEIQECPEAISSLKFWAEDGRFDVIVSGSMLGIDYKRPSSYPVGSMEYLDMTALNFREFLRAMGITDSVFDLLKTSFKTLTPIPDAINKKILELFRLYITIGGMPEAVSIFIESGSMQKTDEKIRAILNDYRYDIAHYAKADIKIKAENCFFSLPEQLAKDNHKFMYSVVEKGGNSRKFADTISWLNGAYLTKCCYNTSVMGFPLAQYKDDTNFRLYPTDIGLLTSMYDFSIKAALLEKEDRLLLNGAKGGIYEAAIADMLIKNGHDALYFRKNEQATFEIEFLIENSDGVIPIEVKSGNSKSRSLDSALQKENIPYGYKLINGNIGKEGKKITLPLYMAMFL